MSVLSKFASEDLDDDFFKHGLSHILEAGAKANRINGEKALDKAKGEKMNNYNTYYGPLTEAEAKGYEEALRQNSMFPPVRIMSDLYDNSIGYLHDLQQKGLEITRGWVGDNPYMYGDIVNDEARKNYGWR